MATRNFSRMRSLSKWMLFVFLLLGALVFLLWSSSAPKQLDEPAGNVVPEPFLDVDELKQREERFRADTHRERLHLAFATRGRLEEQMKKLNLKRLGTDGKPVRTAAQILLDAIESSQKKKKLSGGYEEQSLKSKAKKVLAKIHAKRELKKKAIKNMEARTISSPVVQVDNRLMLKGQQGNATLLEDQTHQQQQQHLPPLSLPNEETVVIDDVWIDKTSIDAI
eukprot:TRINITY_DN8914_c0_g1_i1.p1 TRINITY_DN8914_c0_g1~~TRINITY_DN8914_c0_g1_i1.p1  ORF type:complete len:223 (-),score=45.01 TRINITY_DN8914_c0_g1_i1:490-1158(-)